MIINIGIDIIEKKRIKKNLIKFKKKIIKKLTTRINKCKKKKHIEILSKLFSIKEALTKCLGSGFRNGLTLKKIVIKKNNIGKPYIKLKKYKTYVTISHEKNVTISSIIIIKNNFQ